MTKGHSVDVFLTMREAARELDISEDHVMSLVKRDKLQAYQIAGEYIRLRREDVLHLKETFWTQPSVQEKTSKGIWGFFKNISMFLMLAGICFGLAYYIFYYLL